MGATSVTGVGLGAAWGNKGPGNGRDQFVPLLTPHVVASGRFHMAAGTGVVTFPAPLTGDHTNYAVVITAVGHTSYVSATTDDSDSNFASFTITGTSGDYVSWIVVSVNNA